MQNPAQAIRGAPHIPLGTLRDWEQGRTAPDQPARAYLKVIASNPDWGSRALAMSRDEQHRPSHSNEAITPLITTTFTARPGLASPIRMAHLGVHERRCFVSIAAARLGDGDSEERALEAASI